MGFLDSAVFFSTSDAFHAWRFWNLGSGDGGTGTWKTWICVGVSIIMAVLMDGEEMEVWDAGACFKDEDANISTYTQHVQI